MKVFGLLGCAAATITKQDALELVMGLGEGFFMGSDPLAQTCARDLTDIEAKFQDAITKIAKKDRKDVFTGLVEVATTLKDFPQALSDCKAVEADVKQVEAALALLKHPKEFVFHVGKDLIVHHVQIFKEIFAAVADFKTSSYQNAGDNVGMALRKLLVGAFESFVAEFDRTYESEEEKSRRFAIFTENIIQMSHLQESEQGSAVYSHMTPFADMDSEEFTNSHGFLPELASGDFEMADELDTGALPTGFDWRTKGAVNAVVNQGQCGSCWAFATVANIEGVDFLFGSKTLQKLSEQELVDCDKKTGDQGCQGGLPSNAYKDMITNKIGLELESAYPYKGSNGSCNSQQSLEKVFIDGWKQLSTDEDQIAAGLIQYGPLAIGINATPMQWYHGGIAHPWKFLCNPKELDHGVAIVGFGADGSKPYWIIRNSWGATWGEKGYYYVYRGAGVCGLNTMVTTATMGGKMEIQV